MDNIFEMAQVVMEPTRADILKSLLKESKYISQLAGDIDLDRSNVAYHLSVLEQNNLVSSEYQILVPPHSKGKAARVYSINVKLYKEFIAGIEKLLPQMKLIEG